MISAGTCFPIARVATPSRPDLSNRSTSPPAQPSVRSNRSFTSPGGGRPFRCSFTIPAASGRVSRRSSHPNAVRSRLARFRAKEEWGSLRLTKTVPIPGERREIPSRSVSKKTGFSCMRWQSSSTSREGTGSSEERSSKYRCVNTDSPGIRSGVRSGRRFFLRGAAFLAAIPR